MGGCLSRCVLLTETCRTLCLLNVPRLCYRRSALSFWTPKWPFCCVLQKEENCSSMTFRKASPSVKSCQVLNHALIIAQGSWHFLLEWRPIETAMFLSQTAEQVSSTSLWIDCFLIWWTLLFSAIIVGEISAARVCIKYMLKEVFGILSWGGINENCMYMKHIQALGPSLAGCIHVYGHGGESSAVIDPVLVGGGGGGSGVPPAEQEFSPWAVTPGARGYLWVVDKATQTVHKLKYLDWKSLHWHRGE